MVSRGLTYAQATKAYEAFSDAIADGVTNGDKIGIGNVGALTPAIQKPKTIKMCFERTADGVESVQREYHIGTRLKYKFNIYKTFISTHQLNWFNTVSDQ